MKKYLWTLLIVSTILTGCASAEASEDALRPLDNAAWPTPQPTTVVPTPTPFPKISMADLATSTPTPAATVTPVVTVTITPIESTPVVTAAPGQLSSTALAQADDPTNLPVIAQAQVKSVALNMRQGPGGSFGRIGTLKQGNQVAVLALNPTHDWALVRSPNPGQGWVTLSYLSVDGSLDNAPILKEGGAKAEKSGSKIADNELKIENSGAKVEESGETASKTPELSPMNVTDQGSPTSAPYSLLPTPYPARITHVDVAVRPGPGTDYAQIDTLNNDREAIAVLAVDQTRQYALVQPAHARVGWVALTDLTVDGDMSAAPPVVTTWITNNGLILHRGPGIYFDEIGPVPTNSLMLVLGLNQGRSWALLTPVMGGGQGWMPLQFLTLPVPAAKLPVVKDENKLAVVNSQLPISKTLTGTGSQSHLVFQRSSGGDIMTINPDGSGLRRLTAGIDPALSPDGKTVAFTRWQGDDSSLWLINLDGSNEHSILGFTKQAKGPAWSPDGQQIVLNYQHEGRLYSKSECYDLSEGTPPDPPANGKGYLDGEGNPKIRVDIKSRTQYDLDFCYNAPPDPHWGLRVVNVADGHYEDVDGGTYAFRPTWDPTQPWRIISDSGSGLAEADVTKKTTRRLTDELGDSSPAFSPDGRYLVVTIEQGNGTDMFRLNADGSGRVRLTKTPIWVTATPDKSKPWHNVAPTWSPDGSQIAFLTDRNGRWEIWLMNIDGSNPHPMFSEAVNSQLQITYNFVDEHVLSWR